MGSLLSNKRNQINISLLLSQSLIYSVPTKVYIGNRNSVCLHLDKGQIHGICPLLGLNSEKKDGKEYVNSFFFHGSECSTKFYLSPGFTGPNLREMLAK